MMRDPHSGPQMGLPGMTSDDYWRLRTANLTPLAPPLKIKTLKGQGIQLQVNPQAAAYTPTQTDNYIPITTAAAALVFQLLPAIGSKSQYIFKKVDAGAGSAVVTANGTDTIDGAGTYTLSAQYKFVIIIDRAPGFWDIIGGN